MSEPTQKKIIRLNADALSIVFDRVTVQALLNMVRITGTDTGGVTVPELSDQSDETKALLEVVRQQVILLQVVADYLQAAPADIPPDTSLVDALALFPAPIPQIIVEQVENLQTEVRQLADQVATLTKQFELDMRPMSDQFSQFSNQIITEVRQLADQQVVNTNQIQEIKQGTML